MPPQKKVVKTRNRNRFLSIEHAMSQAREVEIASWSIPDSKGRLQARKQPKWCCNMLQHGVTMKNGGLTHEIQRISH